VVIKVETEVPGGVLPSASYRRTEETCFGLEAKMNRTKIAATIVAITVIVAGCTSTKAGTHTTTPSRAATTTATPAPKPKVTVKPTPKPTAKTQSLTVAQENAVGSAKQYLELQGFSRSGLIKQLSSKYGDGYSLADATFAVNSLNVNWNEQAVRSAKSYLELQHFSRSGLIEQLSSKYGDGYTVAQATYAADHVGL
jgi:Host cell surface-exposed lipoprotein